MYSLSDPNYEDAVKTFPAALIYWSGHGATFFGPNKKIILQHSDAAGRPTHRYGLWQVVPANQFQQGSSSGQAQNGGGGDETKVNKNLSWNFEHY